MTITISPPPAPAVNLSLTDRSTWVAILTALAATVAVIRPGFNLSPYVQSAAALGSGLVVATTIFSKHHLAQGATTVAATIHVADTALPAAISPQLVAAATQASAAATAAALAVTELVGHIPAPVSIPPV